MPSIELNELTFQRLKDYTTMLRLRLKENGLQDVALLLDAERGVFDVAIDQAVNDSYVAWEEPAYWKALIENIKKEQAKEDRAAKRRLK